MSSASSNTPTTITTKEEEIASLSHQHRLPQSPLSDSTEAEPDLVVAPLDHTTNVDANIAGVDGQPRSDHDIVVAPNEQKVYNLVEKPKSVDHISEALESSPYINDDDDVVVVSGESYSGVDPLYQPNNNSTFLSNNDDTIIHNNNDNSTMNDVNNNNDDNVLPIVLDLMSDHFTLQLPSSVIRYRNRRNGARVLHAHNHQLILEETWDESKDKPNIEVRRINDTSEGLRFLRALYMIMTAFWTGFFFVFCLEILLFLFLDLAIQLGITSRQSQSIGAALGVIFSIVPFVYSLSSALVVAGAFVQDTWTGHYLIRNFTFKRLSSVAVEWFFFLTFLGAPLVVMCYTLFCKYRHWWDYVLLTWFCGITCFFILFLVNVVYYELKCAWVYVRTRSRQENNGKDVSSLHILKNCIALRQIITYGGHQTVSFLALGSITDLEETDKNLDTSNRLNETYKEHMGLWGHFTMWKIWSTNGGLGMYQILDEPERRFTVDDARDIRPFMTGFSWSLERVFCRPRHSRYIAIVDGPGALSSSQMRSSFICSVIGTILIFLVLVAGLFYLGAGVGATVVFVLIGVFFGWPAFRSTYDLYAVGREYFSWSGIIHRNRGSNYDEENNVDEDIQSKSDLKQDSEGVYLVQESYKVSEPTPRLYWTMFILEIALLFLWPLASLLRVANYRLAGLFIAVVGTSSLRYYINAIVALEEVGSMMHLNDSSTRKSPAERWRELSRLNEIVGSITTGRSRKFWVTLLGIAGCAYLAVFIMAVISQANATSSGQTSDSFPPFVFLDDFEYLQADSLRYPTCQLSNNLGNSPINTMADFAFLAGVAYRAPGNSTQYELDSWFGNNTAVEEVAALSRFRESYQTTSQADFKLITFPRNLNWAYIAIRGTTGAIDMLTDAEIWAAAGLLQIIRFMLPFGESFTPVLDQLINAITSIETASIQRVSFYKDTTRFANYIKNQSATYGGVAITGHSLGGGLSLISGAQAKIPAVALSGPNAKISRRSFEPPISAEDLDSKTFNIVPERDLVPMIDDKAQNWQSIRCQAGFTDVLACHDSTRSLCEIIYTCGTRGRPVLCDCVKGKYGFTEGYGYPQPVPKAGVNITFEEACANKRAAIVDYFGVQF